MRKLGSTLILIILALGCALTFGSFHNAKLLFDGKTVNINEIGYSDLSKCDTKALATGEIKFAIGPFATQETTHKSYGITTSKDVSSFYIVSTFDADEYLETEDDLPFYVFQASDNVVIHKLDNLSNEWINMFSYLNMLDESGNITEQDINNIPMPSGQYYVNFKGSLVDKLEDAEYFQYYNEGLDALGIKDSDVAKLAILNGEITTRYYYQFIGGIVLIILGLAIIIGGAVARNKASKRQELW
ncbi:MAG: hypothetical protein MJ081_05590 [Ruminococcus sp.]|nr:hypothetical protein [Ruminococcus sp.]